MIAGEEPAAIDLLDRIALIARITVPDAGEEIIVAESDLFEKLRPGELAPEYLIIVTAHRNEAAQRFDFTFEARRLPAVR